MCPFDYVETLITWVGIIAGLLGLLITFVNIFIPIRILKCKQKKFEIKTQTLINSFKKNFSSKLIDIENNLIHIEKRDNEIQKTFDDFRLKIQDDKRVTVIIILSSMAIQEKDKDMLDEIIKMNEKIVLEENKIIVLKLIDELKKYFK